jgi:hypothetical protein
MVSPQAGNRLVPSHDHRAALFQSPVLRETQVWAFISNDNAPNRTTKKTRVKYTYLNIAAKVEV